LDTKRSNWTSQAEAAIRSLRDVDGVRIQTEGDEIREIHVVSSSRRPPKQIVRDIQSLLLTRYQREIDFRVVSVAFTDLDESPAGDGHEPGATGEVRIPAAGAAAPDRNPESVAGLDRIRFGSVNVAVSDRRAQARVELAWRGVPRVGSASGWGTRDGALRLIAQATLATVHEFLDDGVAFSLEFVEISRVGRKDIAVVALELLAHREQKSLVGCCPVEQDAQEAVVLATLSALNRIVGGLPSREPTEYVLRPASS
jgi:hypothetical protein